MTQSQTGRAGELLSLRDLSKSFAGTRALAEVSMDIDRGEVHALLGQNGSGKSTLIKVLSGYHSPDPGGAVWIHGERIRLPIAPGDTRRLGISFLHQDLGLVQTMSVLENLRVGRLATGFGRRVLWRQERSRARALLRRFDLDLDPRTPVGELARTQQAIVGIMRALDDVEGSHGAGLLVLDEPTASLPEGEVQVLFDAVRRVTESGSSVLFVSHRLEEVLAICNRLTVLRDGKVVANRDMAGLDRRALIELILGRELGDMYPVLQHSPAETILEVRNLSGVVVRDASFRVHKGEVLGLTGLIGAGHDEVPYLVYGASKVASGTVTVNETRIDDLRPDRCKQAGLALLPADRQRQSGIMMATVAENVTLPSLRGFGTRYHLDHRQERSTVRELLNRFAVAPPTPTRLLGTLSGGNQQKALLARWIHLKPRVLLLHEPTQGVDVGARKGIFEILQDATRAGTSVVYASAEYEDLANLCDRVLVFRHGLVVAELRGAALNQDQIVAECYAQ